ncbi:MAG: hypothetical protein WC637_02350 [Victivallales bacterium]|jgi:hypothetical protein
MKAFLTPYKIEMIYTGEGEPAINLSQLLDEVFKSFKTYHIDSSKKNCIALEKSEIKGGIFKGTIRAGDYGQTADLLNTTTKTKSYSRKSNEAELWPYYFKIKIMDSKSGIALFQKLGISGFKSIFSIYANDYIRKKHDNYLITINPLVDAKAIQEILNSGKCTEIRFYGKRIPKELADSLSSDNHALTINSGRVVLSVKLKESLNFNFIKEKLFSLAKSYKKRTQYIEIMDAKFNSKDITAIMNYSGRKKEISLEKVFDSLIDYEVDANILGPDGHPIYSKIDDFATGKIKEIEGTAKSQ